LTHSEQRTPRPLKNPLKKCFRHRILLHCLHAAPSNSPNVALQMAHVIGATLSIVIGTPGKVTYNYFLPYTFSKNPSPSSFFNQLVSTISSALILAAFGFCSATYLMTFRVPSSVG